MKDKSVLYGSGADGGKNLFCEAGQVFREFFLCSLPILYVIYNFEFKILFYKFNDKLRGLSLCQCRSGAEIGGKSGARGKLKISAIHTLFHKSPDIQLYIVGHS